MNAIIPGSIVTPPLLSGGKLFSIANLSKLSVSGDNSVITNDSFLFVVCALSPTQDDLLQFQHVLQLQLVFCVSSSGNAGWTYTYNKTVSIY